MSLQALHSFNLRCHSIRRRLACLQGAPLPQEVLLEQREQARKQRAAALAKRKKARAFCDPAQALLERQVLQPEAVTRLQEFELPSQRHARTLRQQQDSEAADRAPVGALTAAGYPYHTSPHNKPGAWNDMQATQYPPAMQALQNHVRQPESSTDTHAMQFLHAVVQPTKQAAPFEPQVRVDNL